MCSVVEIKNQDEYYIHYHSPESLESQQTEEPSSLSVVEELFKRESSIHQHSLTSSVRDSSLESEPRTEEISHKDTCEDSPYLESTENSTLTEDKDFSVEKIELVPSAVPEKPVVEALAEEADVRRDTIIGRQIFDGILQHRLGHGVSGTELSDKDWQMSEEKGRVLEELETEVEEIKRIFKESNGGSLSFTLTSSFSCFERQYGYHVLCHFFKVYPPVLWGSIMVGVCVSSCHPL